MNETQFRFFIRGVMRVGIREKCLKCGEIFTWSLAEAEDRRMARCPDCSATYSLHLGIESGRTIRQVLVERLSDVMQISLDRR